ncbi:hypothetical protein AMTRI_Chr02g220610 [Amborella trichopoda]
MAPNAPLDHPIGASHPTPTLGHVPAPSPTLPLMHHMPAASQFPCLLTPVPKFSTPPSIFALNKPPNRSHVTHSLSSHLSLNFNPSISGPPSSSNDHLSLPLSRTLSCHVFDPTPHSHSPIPRSTIFPLSSHVHCHPSLPPCHVPPPHPISASFYPSFTSSILPSPVASLHNPLPLLASGAPSLSTTPSLEFDQMPQEHFVEGRLPNRWVKCNPYIAYRSPPQPVGTVQPGDCL